MNLLAKARSAVLSHNFRLTLFAGLCLMICCVPSFAQLSVSTTLVDPTAGAQSLAKEIVDGLLYLAASAAFVCFIWGIFRLFSRPLEGIMEIAIGLIVFGLVGHMLAWDAALTGVTVG
jgi:hypothetical protein